MTIEEIRAAKARAEANINAVLMRLHQETTLATFAVNVENIYRHTLESRHSIFVRVNASIELGGI